MKNTRYKKVLLVEFNELTHRLIEQWTASGDLPNFKRLSNQSTRYVTEPDVTEARLMEPWIQWYSLHTGLSYNQHGVFHLTDGLTARDESMFSIVQKAGHSVGIFGCMNQPSVVSEGGFYVSDPWCATESAHPKQLNTFQSFIAQNVLEYSRPDGNDGKVSSTEFISFMLRNGLTSRTIVKAVKQLAGEKLVDKVSRWKRVEILDWLNLDVFFKLYEERNPKLAAFFSNSTAHLQHTYWRDMDPAPFTVKPEAEHQEEFKDAILFGYKNMDKMLGTILDRVAKDTLVIFATALGQQPFLKKEATGGQIFYRLKNPEDFLKGAGISNFELLPVMTHQYKISLKSAEDADDAVHKLRSFTIEGQPLFVVHHKESSSELLIGALVSKQVPVGGLFESNGLKQSFSDVFYLLEGMKSGCHHPEGMLWIANGQSVDAGFCSILDVMPTVLGALGLENQIPNACKGKDLGVESGLQLAA